MYGKLPLGEVQMYRLRIPLTCSALLRSLFRAARLLGVIGSVLLVCACTAGSSTDASSSSVSAANSSGGAPTPSTSTPPAEASPPSSGTSSPSTGQVSLAWDAVSTPDVRGYRLYYGQTSGTYTSPIDVGPLTTYT